VSDSDPANIKLKGLSVDFFTAIRHKPAVDLFISHWTNVMGISNRDYYREPAGRSTMFGFDMGSMTKRLVIVTVVVFVLQLMVQLPTPVWRLNLDYVPKAKQAELLQQAQELDRQSWEIGIDGGAIRYVSVLEKWGAAIPLAVQRGEIWRLLTYAFLHDQHMLLHIIFNMLALWSFGPLMEARWGRREFLAFYCTAAIFAGLCHVILGLSVKEYGGAVGASGAVMGLLMAFAVYYPHQLITVYFFTLEARVLVLLYALWDGYPTLKMLMGQGSRSDGVAHAAHLGGLAFGFLYCTQGWRLTGWLDGWHPNRPRPGIQSNSNGRSGGFGRWFKRLFQSGPNLKIHTDPPEPQRPRDLESQVDRVLKKIKDVGEENITEEERNVLREAAREYRKRDE
jgi:membrane associated rhomboid family serine protease